MQNFKYSNRNIRGSTNTCSHLELLELKNSDNNMILQEDLDTNFIESGVNKRHLTSSRKEEDNDKGVKSAEIKVESGSQ